LIYLLNSIKIWEVGYPCLPNLFIRMGWTN
jgi:hypothetical protein